MAAASIDLKSLIRDIPDFPKPGILFKDITPLLSNAAAFKQCIKQLADRYRQQQIEAVVAAEARGFIFAAPLALELGVGFTPIRKPGKLPYQTHTHEYDLEYGSDKLQIHIDGVGNGHRVLVVDDLLATGGTVEACCKLVEKIGGNVVECCFLIELAFLEGRNKLSHRKVFSLLTY
jgi:adenine phosphoribosyltransferase